MGPNARRFGVTEIVFETRFFDVYPKSQEMNIKKNCLKNAIKQASISYN